MRRTSANEGKLRLTQPRRQANQLWRTAGAGLAAVFVVGVSAWLVWPLLPFGSAPPRPPGTAPVATQPAPARPSAEPSDTRSNAAPPPPAAQPAMLRPSAPAADVVPALAPFPIRSADEAQIAGDVPSQLTVFRFALDPSIVLLDFPSLRMQGMMLNRVAALVEKAAAPRDRVLDDAQLSALIHAGGDTVGTFYYGHDYSAASLARFFTLAAQQHIQLDAQEQELYRLLQQLGWLVPGVHGALLSLPRAGANAEVTAATRRAILRHELSHGEYFSNPGYAAYVHQFWELALTDAERAAVRRFLASEEYDTTDAALVEDEMQAYLMFTQDSDIFSAEMIGMHRSRLAELQSAFLRNMPEGWLHDLLQQMLAANGGSH